MHAPQSSQSPRDHHSRGEAPDEFAGRTLLLRSRHPVQLLHEPFFSGIERESIRNPIVCVLGGGRGRHLRNDVLVDALQLLEVLPAGVTVGQMHLQERPLFL